jgi:hypothetical protein
MILDLLGAAGEQFILATVQLTQAFEVERFCAAKHRLQFTDNLFGIDQVRRIGDLCQLRSAHGFDNHVIALLQCLDTIRIEIICLARILESDANHNGHTNLVIYDRFF